MADEKGYTYVVLARISDRADPEVSGGFSRPTYHSLGDHQGRSPEEAITAAANEHGLPSSDGGDNEVVAIPASKFHTRQVKSRTEQVHEIIATTSRPAVGAFPAEDLPPPRDPGKPGSVT